MIKVLKYIVLGLVQGIAEVLPISSSGHLIIVENLFNAQDDNLAFEIFLHLASLIAILFFLRKKLWALIKGFCLYLVRRKEEYKLEFKYGIMVIISTIPVVIFTLLFKDLIDKVNGTLWVVGLLLMVNGVVLWTLSHIKGTRKKEELNYLDALVIGCGQCFGIFPGISRSGSCLCGAFTRKIEKETAADYAFILFIPAVLGATVLEFTHFSEISIDTSMLALYGISFIVAMVTTYFSFVLLLKVIRKGKLSWFGYYCLAIGLFTFIYGLVK